MKKGVSRYFRELLQRIRDIRSSERNFCQQVADIYAFSTRNPERYVSSVRFMLSQTDGTGKDEVVFRCGTVVFDQLLGDGQQFDMERRSGFLTVRDDSAVPVERGFNMIEGQFLHI